MRRRQELNLQGRIRLDRVPGGCRRRSAGPSEAVLKTRARSGRFTLYYATGGKISLTAANNSRTILPGEIIVRDLDRGEVLAGPTRSDIASIVAPIDKALSRRPRTATLLFLRGPADYRNGDFKSCLDRCARSLSSLADQLLCTTRRHDNSVNVDQGKPLGFWFAIRNHGSIARSTSNLQITL